jgi:Arc/MetJ-type ribon-helix-helix transcriptional regulator
MNKNLRITVRVEEPDRRKIETLIQSGKYKNLSEVLREAISKLLNECRLP